MTITILSEMGLNVSELKNCCISCIFILNHILSITVVFCHSFMVFTVKTKLKCYLFVVTRLLLLIQLSNCTVCLVFRNSSLYPQILRFPTYSTQFIEYTVHIQEYRCTHRYLGFQPTVHSSQSTHYIYKSKGVPTDTQVPNLQYAVHRVHTTYTRVQVYPQILRFPTYSTQIIEYTLHIQEYRCTHRY